ncbi:hypothetical protein [Pusillimonas sp. NJUB218]|uniref:hypothetical protein n=1 Tax=Pusillimonas sp. NJUB218 TaxID=2023230 RepID=UPI000F4B3119|nr:hypothetical protein [Pusillimonas sp. NJUB218]ROT44306.1 hypothetical protein CHR62_13390 [Pusillimonas sp. NJUB218]
MTNPTTLRSPETQAILNALQTAVTKCLDKKKKLGQYAVIWQDGRPVKIGGDAEAHESAPGASTPR